MAVTINGSAGVTTNSGAVYDSLQRATAVTASGTSVDFTSIPSWVRRITVMFSGVSTNGTSNLIVQLGDSGGVETTGYASAAQSSATAAASTAGYILTQTVSATTAAYAGHCVITLSGSNLWVASSVISSTNASFGLSYAGGTKTLSDTLDRVRITTVNGTDTFDAGTINIIYE